MSEVEREQPHPLVGEVARTFARVREIDETLAPLIEERQSRIEDLRRKISELGVPPELRLSTAALLSADELTHKWLNYHENLIGLDLKLSQSGGQMIVWSGTEIDTVIYRDPVGPNVEEIKHYIGIGFLPEEAGLKVYDT